MENIALGILYLFIIFALISWGAKKLGIALPLGILGILALFGGGE